MVLLCRKDVVEHHDDNANGGANSDDELCLRVNVAEDCFDLLLVQLSEELRILSNLLFEFVLSLLFDFLELQDLSLLSLLG